MVKDERYTERQFIAGGRFSSVYRAKDDGAGVGSGGEQLVALKITTPEDDRPPHNSRHELKILQSLAAKGAGKFNVIQILESFEADHIDLVMVFPYLPFTLTQFMKHNSTKIKPKFNPYLTFAIDDDTPMETAKPTYENNLDLSRAKQIMSGIANGLAFLHANGIIHRDIKPANIMFQNFSSNPVIIDFGISYQYPNNFDKENPMDKISDIATSVYKAPEVIFGIRDYSYGVDIWSFGILITSLFSKNIEPVFKCEELSDFRLFSLIFEHFGMPTLNTWPEAIKSKTFGRLELTEKPGKPIESILPRADDQVKSIFQKMMVYESNDRLPAAKIVEHLALQKKY